MRTGYTRLDGRFSWERFTSLGVAVLLGLVLWGLIGFGGYTACRWLAGEGQITSVAEVPK